MPREKPECPACGSTEHTWRNSSDEVQCDNCGYDETAEADEIATEVAQTSDQEHLLPLKERNR